MQIVELLRNALDTDYSFQAGYKRLGVPPATVKLSCLRPTTGDQGLRRSKRIPMKLWAGSPAPHLQPTVTKDLSLEGCRLTIGLSDYLGQTFPLYLDLPDTEGPVKVVAKVVWSGKDECGVKFLNLPTQSEIRLVRVLGKAAVGPSHLLPQFTLDAPSFTYQFQRVGSRCVLLLSVAAWSVRFEFGDVRYSGSMRGSFSELRPLGFSHKLRQFRRSREDSSEATSDIVHFQLVDERGKVRFELVGEEVGVSPEPRL